MIGRVNALLAWLERRTVNLLDVYWWAVEAVAEVLLTDGTMSGWLVKKVIGRAMDTHVKADGTPIEVKPRRAAPVVMLRPRPARPGAD
jgi:hypothetical protein